MNPLNKVKEGVKKLTDALKNVGTVSAETARRVELHKKRVHAFACERANNRAKGSKYIKTSYSALGRMASPNLMIKTDSGKLIPVRDQFRYN